MHNVRKMVKPSWNRVWSEPSQISESHEPPIVGKLVLRNTIYVTSKIIMSCMNDNFVSLHLICVLRWKIFYINKFLVLYTRCIHAFLDQQHETYHFFSFDYYFITWNSGGNQKFSHWFRLLSPIYVESSW